MTLSSNLLNNSLNNSLFTIQQTCSQYSNTVAAPKITRHIYPQNCDSRVQESLAQVPFPQHFVALEFQENKFYHWT